MSGSILNDTKRMLDIGLDDDSFDMVIMIQINSVLSKLSQLGIGPSGGVFIEDATATWDLITGGDPRFNAVKTYVHLNVRMLFDPPATSFVLTSYKELLEETGWRLNLLAEGINNTSPPEVVLDGGDADGNV